jgi:hypothetical protein
MRKLMTKSEAETKRRKAVEFLRRMGKSDDADRFDAMDAAEYAEHKGAQLLENPNRNRRQVMARELNPTKGELSEILEQIVDLAEEALDPELTREEVVAKVKELADLASEEEPEEEEGEDEDEDEEEAV